MDDEDYDEIAQHKWSYSSHWGYAERRRGAHKIRMHRVIMGREVGDPVKVDHRNGNRLDNRRSNLRDCTTAENNQNRLPNKRGSSRFRGVHWDKRVKRWRAGVKSHGKMSFGGYFDIEEDAAKAASLLRQKLLPFSHETIPRED